MLITNSVCVRVCVCVCVRACVCVCVRAHAQMDCYGVVSVKPDFSSEDEPYRIETRNRGKSTCMHAYTYTIGQSYVIISCVCSEQ